MMSLKMWGLVLVVAAVGGCNDPASSSPSECDDVGNEPKRERRPPAASGSAMPLGSIRLESPAAGATAYLIDEDTLVQVLALAAMNAFPVSEGEDGYRVDAVPDGSVLALAGLHKGDVVTHVNGMPILERDVLRKAYAMFHTARAVGLTVRRDGKTLPFTYDLRRSVLPSAASRQAPPEVAAGVREVSENTFEVSRAVLDKILANPSQSARSARIVPAIESGSVVGLKIYGVRRGSLASVFGFRNGDRVDSVNGMKLDTPEKGVEAFQKLRGQSKVVVKGTRRGRPLELTYTIIDP